MERSNTIIEIPPAALPCVWCASLWKPSSAFGAEMTGNVAGVPAGGNVAERAVVEILR